MIVPSMIARSVGAGFAMFVRNMSVLALTNRMGFLTGTGFTVNYDGIANSIDLGYDDGEWVVAATKSREENARI